jgi:hypothetical protein
MQSPYNSSFILSKKNGTVLRDHPEVETMAKLFKTFKVDPVIARQLPEKFDGRSVWENYLAQPSYIDDCASDWVQIVADVMRDRFMLMTLTYIDRVLSATEIYYCDSSLKRPVFTPGVKSQENIDITNVCGGYSVFNALKFASINGFTDNHCFNNEEISELKFQLPNSSTNLSDFQSKNKCSELSSDSCVDKKHAKRVFRIKGVVMVDSDEASIKADIFKMGPSIGGMLLYDDLRDSFDTKEVYQGPSSSAKLLGGVSVRIVGWGITDVDKDKPDKPRDKYWICAMPWSIRWGNGGFFKIKMGVTECMLENNVMSPVIDLLGVPFEPIEYSLPDDWSKARTNIDQDVNTYYPNKTIELIKQNKLVGYTDPLIDNFEEDLPDYKKYFAGDIDLYISEFSYDNKYEYQRLMMLRKYGFIFTLLISPLIGILLVKYLLKKKII